MKPLTKVKNSKIQGKGVFSTRKINKFEVIGPAIILHYRIIPEITKGLGTMVNHSYNSNCELVKSDNIHYFVASETIPEDSEILLNYNTTPWYIMNAMPWYS